MKYGILAFGIKRFVRTYETACILSIFVCIQGVKMWEKTPQNQAVYGCADGVRLFLTFVVTLECGSCVMVRLRQHGLPRQTAKARR